MKVLLTQSCLILYNPMDCSPSGSFVHGILQARILEWVAIPSSRDLLDAGIESGSSTLQADSLPSELPGKPSHIINSQFFELLCSIKGRVYCLPNSSCSLACQPKTSYLHSSWGSVSQFRLNSNPFITPRTAQDYSSYF